MKSVRIGFTGHQGLDAGTEISVLVALEALLSQVLPVTGISSLAEGSDQIFARAVLDSGGTLEIVVPCKEYEQTFNSEIALSNYRSLLSRASRVIELDYLAPTEEAFWAAGQRVVLECERVVAVWDGKPAVGLGGTADVVEFARKRGMQVDVVWPLGASRK